MTVEKLERWLSTHVAELREQLLNGSYQPQEVKGVSIPKQNGGWRQLGLPTAIDRLVQIMPPKKGLRRFLESIGCKRKLRSGIVAMGKRRRVACSQPANICMDNA